MKRTIAFVVIMVLAVGVFAGAFLLPSTSTGGAKEELLAATKRLLSAPSYHSVLLRRSDSTTRSVEEFQAPDRYRERTTFTTSPSALGESAVVLGDRSSTSELIVIGTTAYLPWSCTTESGAVEGFHAQAMQHGYGLTPSGYEALSMITRATRVNRAGRSTYTLSVRELRFPDTPELNARFSDVTATTSGGKLRRLTYTASPARANERSPTRTVLVFRSPGTTKLIVAPPASELNDPEECGISFGK